MIVPDVHAKMLVGQDRAIRAAPRRAESVLTAQAQRLDASRRLQALRLPFAAAQLEPAAGHCQVPWTHCISCSAAPAGLGVHDRGI